MSKINLKEIEILHSIYQFSDQYGDATTAVKQCALLECLRNLENETDGRDALTNEVLKKYFPNLSEDEYSVVRDAYSHHVKAPTLSPSLANILQDNISKEIKKEWVESTFSIAKKVIPLIALCVLLYFVGQKIFYPKHWRATYFQNTQLSGNPFGTYFEASPNHNWGFEPPQAGMGPNNYSVRFESILVVSEADYYTFKTVSDDGARLYIDDELILDFWILQDSISRETTKYLGPGEHTVRLEYFEAEAVAKLEFDISNSKSTNIKIKPPRS